MRHRCVIFVFLAVWLVTTLLAHAISPEEKEAREAMYYYFDLLLFNNIESAEGLWLPEAIERAKRLGISYEGIVFKPDSHSPVVYDLDGLRDVLQAGVRIQPRLDTSFIRIKFDIEHQETRVQHFYYMKMVGGYYWFTYADDYYARGWDIEETKYFRFHIDPDAGKLFNRIAAQSLDDFVETVAEKIAISDERLVLLEKEKIDYFVCQTALTVRALAGDKQVEEFYNPGADAVYSINFPNYSIVARLLINFKLQELPLSTVPFLQDGLAVYLSGSWQRGPEVIADFGEYLLRHRVIEIDSLLPPNDSTTLIDITAPVSACVIEYLISELGLDRFFELYRSLSGQVQAVKAIGADEIKDRLTGFLNVPWAEFAEEAIRYAENRRAHGGAIHPGEIETNRVLVNDSGLILSVSDEWVKVEFTADEGTRPDLNIFFGKQEELDGKRSLLLTEQYKNNLTFKGYRFGIRLDKNEIGVYDYATNQLKAKYVYDFDPDPGYYDAERNRVTAYFDIGILDDVLPSSSDYLLLR
ncbi:MAG: hypothetical protein JSV44_00095 [Candidatus Zixiibacteriota bacterium]|nr:MAG: hypothetical protein JSV44_00095 [candidate division Zixibacteria bacterium]